MFGALPDGFNDDFLNMIMASNSITTVVVRESARSLQVEVIAFCLLNAEFSSARSIGSSELWARILTKIQDGQARATFLYRLLRETPDWIVSTMQSPYCGC